MPTFNFTKAVREELIYKLGIFAEDEDMYEGYEMTEAEAEALLERVKSTKPGLFEASDIEAEVISAQLENAAEIERDNAEDEGNAGRYSFAARLAKAAIPVA